MKIKRKRHMCVTLTCYDTKSPGNPISEHMFCCDLPVGKKVPKFFKNRIREKMDLILEEVERVIA